MLISLKGGDKVWTILILFFLPFFLSSFLLKVSKCSEEIKNYIEERSGEDPLVKGIPEDKNPFKEKGSCIISWITGETLRPQWKRLFAVVSRNKTNPLLKE